ncbi:MAG: dihydrofolate reductase family protein [Terriglobales bacterium]
MRRLVVFNNVTLDGYFVDSHGDMSWAHKGREDAEWTEFTDQNATSGGGFLFGRVTYELMKSFWTTQQAAQMFPVVAERMNNLPKVVFSRTLDSVSWENTTLAKGELAAEVRRIKQEPGADLVILGSGSIVAQLAQEGLIDEFQIALIPVALGKGRTMFEGMREKLALRLVKSRVFGNGAVFLSYEPE